MECDFFFSFTFRTIWGSCGLKEMKLKLHRLTWNLQKPCIINT